ncbi:MAG: cobS [Candidatus Binatus sp.]|nr:cobS [Candidatus Binatus sp.]
MNESDLGENPAPDSDRTAPAILPKSPGFLAELRLAFSFLTILPVLGDRVSSDQAVADSFAWFPLVGLLLGLALCGIDVGLSIFVSDAVRSVLLLIALVVVTGGIHLDALADTADAFGAKGDRDRALAILHDSRIGTFGAAAIFFDLTLKVFALSSLAGQQRYAALLLAPTISRWAMVAVAEKIEYLRPSGAGEHLLAHHSRSTLLKASTAAAIVVLSVLSIHAISATALAIAIVALCRWFYRRWLGGVTGDLIGACGEIVEIAILIAMAQ